MLDVIMLLPLQLFNDFPLLIFLPIIFQRTLSVDTLVAVGVGAPTVLQTWGEVARIGLTTCHPSLVLRGLLVFIDLPQEVKLLITRVELWTLVFALLQNTCDDLFGDCLVFFDLLSVQRTILSGCMGDAEFDLVADHGHLPLLVAI